MPRKQDFGFTNKTTHKTLDSTQKPTKSCSRGIVFFSAIFFFNYSLKGLWVFRLYKGIDLTHSVHGVFYILTICNGITNFNIHHLMTQISAFAYFPSARSIGSHLMSVWSQMNVLVKFLYIPPCNLSGCARTVKKESTKSHDYVIY